MNLYNLIPVNYDPLLKDMAFCMLQQYEVIDKNRKLYKDRLKELCTEAFGEGKTKTVLEKCAKEEDTEETPNFVLFETRKSFIR